jgi:hypothetical protein
MAKHRRIIAPDDVPTVFDDDCIRGLAKLGKLPANADFEKFAAGIREAARIFAGDARVPTDNELRREIEALWKASDRQCYAKAAELLEALSPRARATLSPGKNGAALVEHKRNLDLELPSPDALRDPARRDDALAAIGRISALGGRYVLAPPSKGPGRHRHLFAPEPPQGQRTQWRPVFYAPDARRNFQKRAPERDFVMWLRLAWTEATGESPSRTARRAEESYRDLGPFARFVRECLRLAGAPYADVAELINELERRRRAALNNP